MIAIATGLLLAAGAGALATAHTETERPTFQQPFGAAAPFGVGYVDGFGEHSPMPAPPSSPSRRPAKSTGASIPPPAPPTRAAIFTSPSPAAPGTDSVASGLSAVYWSTSWRGGYEIYVWVHNDGATATPWQVKLQLPPGATVTTYWEAEGVDAGKDTWQFTAPRGTGLGSGRTYLFAFEGKRPTGSFRVYSCSVNGISCASF